MAFYLEPLTFILSPLTLHLKPDARRLPAQLSNSQNWSEANLTGDACRLEFNRFFLMFVLFFDRIQFTVQLHLSE